MYIEFMVMSNADLYDIAREYLLHQNNKKPDKIRSEVIYNGDRVEIIRSGFGGDYIGENEGKFISMSLFIYVRVKKQNFMQL